MGKPLELFIIAIGALSIVIADILLKKIATETTGFIAAIKHPIMVPVIILYIFQIAAYTYVFVHKAQLSTVSIVQTALYMILLTATGMYVYGETLSVKDGVGIVFALVGVTLLV